ncbi:hypothetical protein JCM5296_000545 [Sporobolomyces johnsonii]
MSTSYHPQSNGRVERMHRDLNQILRQFVNDNQDDWAAAIPMAQFALNSRKSGTTTFSPFELARLRSPENFPGFMPVVDTEIDYGEDYEESWNRTAEPEDVVEATTAAQPVPAPPAPAPPIAAAIPHAPEIAPIEQQSPRLAHMAVDTPHATPTPADRSAADIELLCTEGVEITNHQVRNDGSVRFFTSQKHHNGKDKFVSIRGDDVKRRKLLLQTPTFSRYAAKKHARCFEDFQRQRAQTGNKREDFDAAREIERLRAEKASMQNELNFQRHQAQEAHDEVARLKELLNEAPSTEAFNIYRTYYRVHMGSSQLRTLDNAGFNAASQSVLLSGLIDEGQIEIVPAPPPEHLPYDRTAYGRPHQ